MNIALIGYGKMGHMIEQIARERGHNIVSIIDVDNQADFESEAFAAYAHGVSPPCARHTVGSRS